MSLYREWRAGLPFDPAAGASVVGYRRADDPRVARASLALGAFVALALATGGGLAPPVDWGAAGFCGLVAAVAARGLLIAGWRLSHGGWRAWRRRAADEAAMGRLSAGVGIALALCLASGAGGLRPVVAPAGAALAGLGGALLARGLLALARWP